MCRSFFNYSISNIMLKGIHDYEYLVSKILQFCIIINNFIITQNNTLLFRTFFIIIYFIADKEYYP